MHPDSALAAALRAALANEKDPAVRAWILALLADVK
jgi:hypothetical protein